MSSTHADSYATCLQDSLDSSGHWRVQVGDTEALEAVLSHVWSLSRSDVADLTVEVLTLDETVKNLDASVPLRLKTSELTSANILQIRKTAAEGQQLPSVIVSHDTAVSLLPAEGIIYTEITEPEIRSRLWDHTERVWQQSIQHRLEMPQYTQFLIQAEHELGAEFREDVEAMLESPQETAYSDLSPVEQMLVIGAEHEVLVKSIVDWFEKTSFQTQGTTSKTKQRLEQQGIITTEPENIGVGRPRQRLFLQSESPVTDSTQPAD